MYRKQLLTCRLLQLRNKVGQLPFHVRTCQKIHPEHLLSNIIIPSWYAAIPCKLISIFQPLSAKIVAKWVISSLFWLYHGWWIASCASLKCRGWGCHQWNELYLNLFQLWKPVNPPKIGGFFLEELLADIYCTWCSPCSITSWPPDGSISIKNNETDAKHFLWYSCSNKCSPDFAILSLKA